MTSLEKEDPREGGVNIKSDLGSMIEMTKKGKIELTSFMNNA